MALSAPCTFDKTEQNLTPPHVLVQSATIMRSYSSSVTMSSSLLSEAEVVSDVSFNVYFITSLNTLLPILINGGMTISEVKREVMRSHSSAFPRFGEIKINDIKLKCQSCFHSLEDSMRMSIILNESKDVLLLDVDASSSVNYLEEQHLWSDSEEEDCLDSAVADTACIICLRGLGASSLGPRETDGKETSLQGLNGDATC